MKIAVINFSGNVGKSTIARHLLAPRMNNAEVIPVESINSDDTTDTAIRGKEFGQLQEYLQTIDNAVVDIGASNVEDFIKLMKQYTGSHEDFDFFVVPTVPAKKQQRDTIGTIDAISSMGVPSKKIRLLFNMVDQDDNLESVFSGLFAYNSDKKNFVISPSAVIYSNELFEKIKNSDDSIKEILADGTDYKEMIKTETDSGKKLALAQKVSIKRLATGVSKELDTTFKALFK